MQTLPVLLPPSHPPLFLIILLRICLSRRHLGWGTPSGRLCFGVVAEDIASPTPSRLPASPAQRDTTPMSTAASLACTVKRDLTRTPRRPPVLRRDGDRGVRRKGSGSRFGRGDSDQRLFRIGPASRAGRAQKSFGTHTASRHQVRLRYFNKLSMSMYPEIHHRL